MHSLQLHLSPSLAFPSQASHSLLPAPVVFQVLSSLSQQLQPLPFSLTRVFPSLLQLALPRLFSPIRVSLSLKLPVQPLLFAHPRFFASPVLQVLLLLDATVLAFLVTPPALISVMQEVPSLCVLRSSRCCIVYIECQTPKS